MSINFVFYKSKTKKVHISSVKGRGNMGTDEQRHKMFEFY